MAMNDQPLLRIDVVDVPRHQGRIGLCACPGGRRTLARDHDPSTDLINDLERIVEFGARGVVSLIDDRELIALGIESLPVLLQRKGLWWKHLPITDMGIPNADFEQHWQANSTFIREALSRGEDIVMHCWAGLGRTGTIAARLLIECGMEPAAAIIRLRDARPGSIQTRKQEKYVLRLNSSKR
ncbi:MAG: protein-tyrosine phosphatase [Gammaproteobacteria bacterium]|jgi:protein-tyrosine phosphatase